MQTLTVLQCRLALAGSRARFTPEIPLSVFAALFPTLSPHCAKLATDQQRQQEVVWRKPTIACCQHSVDE